MGDENIIGDKIMKMKSLRKGEEVFLMRSCLKDGMTQEQAKDYIHHFKEEVKNNHEGHNKKINKLIKKRKKSFSLEFRKMKEKKNNLKKNVERVKKKKNETSKK